MNFPQRVLSGAASVSFVAAGVLGLGAAWASSHGPQGSPSLASLGTPRPALTASTDLPSPTPSGTGHRGWRSVPAAALVGGGVPDVVAGVHRSAVAA